MLSLTVFLNLTLVVFSLGVGVHEISPEEKQNIMNEVNILKKETMIRRNRVNRGRNPEEYRPVKWDARLASTAQEVANRLQWGEDNIPSDERFYVSMYSGNMNLTHDNKIQGVGDWLRRLHRNESEKFQLEKGLSSHEELLNHHKMCVEGQLMGCGAYAHHQHPDRPLYLVCLFSEKPKQ